MNDYIGCYERLTLLMDYAIGGVDMARNVAGQGKNSDVLPPQVHDGLSGTVEYLMTARKIIDKMLEMYQVEIKQQETAV